MKIQLDKLKAGTILDGKVTREDGTILFPNRTVFTKDILRKLKVEKIQIVEYFPLKENTKITDSEKREDEFLEKIVDGFHYGGITKEVVKIQLLVFEILRLTYSTEMSQSTLIPANILYSLFTSKSRVTHQHS